LQAQHAEQLAGAGANLEKLPAPGLEIELSRQRAKRKISQRTFPVALPSMSALPRLSVSEKPNRQELSRIEARRLRSARVSLIPLSRHRPLMRNTLSVR
jgi:hypothetical protein